MSHVIDAGIEGNSRVFFVQGERTAIVDTGGPGNERKILRTLKSALNVPVLAGWPDADYLEKGENLPVMNIPGKIALPRAAGPKFDGVKADVIVTEDMSLDNYGIDALVLKTPGHGAKRFFPSHAASVEAAAVLDMFFST